MTTINANSDAAVYNASSVWLKLFIGTTLILHAGLLAWSAVQHSPTYNEPAHLVAGISHWQLQKFDLYRVNPPLVRMVAAIPAVIRGQEVDWSRFDSSPRARSEFPIGRDFFRQHGESGLNQLVYARWACLLFSVLGAYICLRWAREIAGHCAGNCALVLWCFSPNVLGHACLIAPDAHATSMCALSGYTFWRWLNCSTAMHASKAGLALGLALLSKSTLLVLCLWWPCVTVAVGLLANASVIFGRKRPRDGDGLMRHSYWHIVAIVFISLIVLNLGYGLRGSFQPLKEFDFVSQRFAGGFQEHGQSLLGNRWRNSYLGSVPSPFPNDFLRGIDLQFRDFESGAAMSYMHGRFSEKGWWYYYFYGILVKTPLALLALALFGVIGWGRRKNLLSADLFVLISTPLVLIAVVSSQSGFSHHVRYAFLAYPFVIVAIAVGISAILKLRDRWGFLVSLLLTWFVGSSLAIYPHSLAYFNELVGGPRRGSEFLLDSNLDWGQDSLWLRDWYERTQPTEPFTYLHYSLYDPQYIGVPTLGSQAEKMVEELASGNAPPPGWYAISSNLLTGLSAHVMAADKQVYIPANLLDWFRRHKPLRSFGYSIHLYYVDENSR